MAPRRGNLAPLFFAAGVGLVLPRFHLTCASQIEPSNKALFDHWRLTVDGRNSPRMIKLCSPSFPIVECAPSKELVLFIQQAPFLSNVEERACHIIPDFGMGAILANSLLGLERNFAKLTTEEALSLAEPVAAMLAVCLEFVIPRGDASAQDRGSGIPFERIRRYVHANLHITDLGPALLCDALGFSRSRLYRLFEPMGGVRSYIQRQRLLAARAELAEEVSLPINRVAEQFGFKDASGFSRAFKKEFGFPPSVARKGHTSCFAG